MTVLDELDRIETLLESVEMVRASEIARRCGVDRATVSRWKLRLHWDESRWIHVGFMPVAHLVVADVEYWSWPLLQWHDPARFGGVTNPGSRA